MSFPTPPGQEPQQPPQWGPQPPQQPYQQWPQQAPGWGAPPPRKSNTGLIVTLSIVGGLLVIGAVIGLLAMLGSEISKAAKSSPPVPARSSSSAPVESAPAEEPAIENGPEADVKLSKCVVDPLTTWPSVVVEIVNHGDGAATYVVNVEFVDAGGTRVAEGLAASDEVAKGQKVRTTAQGLGKAPSDTKCKVTKVTRYPST
ncbi:FxLYD domain-containing protein [Streptomyces sp. NBC_00316]|uniref:FxLYD domain-containing protein n=1 Tax=Streptomyces sp. NBC_00316 TaxID=2975710 RepID=UPI002E2CDF6E|nr:FxLYD domain-containing protein [Streptomyces sp. NBC_00316]